MNYQTLMQYKNNENISHTNTESNMTSQYFF